MELVKQFTNNKDRVFNAVVSEDTNYNGGLVVRFYDAKSANRYKELAKKYPDSFAKEAKFGQFTGGGYYIDTLLGLDGFGDSIRGRGLCFDGGNADSWSIDADTSTQVFLWLSEIREHQERVEMFKELETRSEMLVKQLEETEFTAR